MPVCRVEPKHPHRSSMAGNKPCWARFSPIVWRSNVVRHSAWIAARLQRHLFDQWRTFSLIKNPRQFDGLHALDQTIGISIFLIVEFDI